MVSVNVIFSNVWLHLTHIITELHRTEKFSIVVVVKQPVHEITHPLGGEGLARLGG